ncbi:MAG: MOSC domain-containing protein [Pirellulales bacterium]
MADSSDLVGTIDALWRFPVKSMGGEELAAVDVGPGGLVGDRRLALIDRETGAVASAKNPRKWSRLLDCQATFGAADPARPEAAVAITLADGTRLSSDEAGAEDRLADYFGREIDLRSAPAAGHQIEMMFPEDASEQVVEVPIAEGMFFDAAPVHLLTTASLNELAKTAPDSRFDVLRFRPNLVIAVPAEGGFVENEWIGRSLRIGAEVELSIIGPCPRCIMTTVSQGDLPKDPAVLRAAAERNDANIGVYAQVVSPGKIRRGDPVRLK